jgi:signal transduction histidine kinase
MPEMTLQGGDRGGLEVGGAGDRGRGALLIVEDNEALRTEIADLFRDDGFHVVEAGDGATALDLLRHGPTVDLVLLDLWMPRMDGWRFRMAQRRDASLQEIPVIVLTADDSAQAQAIDADAVLAKPFQADQLFDTVHRVLSRRDEGQRWPLFVRDALALIAGAVGHEIANPLTVLIHTLEHVRSRGRKLGDDPEAPEITELLRQCWRMVETLRALRDLPAPRSLQQTNVDLSQAVKIALGGTPRAAAIELLESGPARVAADAQVVHYVCRALVRNALEALEPPELGGREERKVRVTVGRKDDQVLLDVWDPGPALSPDELDRAFSPDYMGRGEGWSAGLRLWFVREAVQSLGGSVELSNGKDGGVQCRVRLPAA